MVGQTEISMSQLLLSTLAAWCIYAIFRALHNVLLHPLAKFPGPKMRGAFYFPHYLEHCSGNEPSNWHHLHERYGDVVRVSPNTLSIIKSEAWRDIYGNKQPMSKNPAFYYRFPGQAVDIIAASHEDHARIRRLLNYAFSEHALRGQEDMITSYINFMISKLHKRAASNSPVDIMKWMNFSTFDITGDLMFDETFGSLESENYHSWIAKMLNLIRLGCVMYATRAYGIHIEKLFGLVPSLARTMTAHANLTKEKTVRRLEKKTNRKDFMSYILRHNDERGMTEEEIKETSGVIIMAGSETSATLLTGAIYYLLQNPSWLSKLQNEIRTAFRDEAQITFSSVSQLKVLNAVINETLRLYPPFPIYLPRVTPKDGATIAGTYIPPMTVVGIPHYAAYRSSRHFKNAGKYAPERFMGDEDYAEDNRSVVQPFSVGPRNCIGQNLAWAEIRAILTKLLWHFDIEMLNTSKDWEKQGAFVLWSKPSLMVKLKARKS